MYAPLSHNMRKVHDTALSVMNHESTNHFRYSNYVAIGDMKGSFPCRYKVSKRVSWNGVKILHLIQKI